MPEKDRVDFSNPEGSVISTEVHTGPITAGEWETIDGVEGVRFRTWKFKEVSEEIVDGALVEI